MPISLACIGFGNMGQAFVEGLLTAELLAPSSLQVASRSVLRRLDSLPSWARNPAVLKTADNASVVRDVDVVLLAFPPDQALTVAGDLRGRLRPNQLVVSLLSGITLAQMAEWGLGTPKLARIMPNTPSCIQESATAVCYSGFDPAEARQLLQLCRATGPAFEINEALFPLWGSSAGAGPAYVFEMLEAFSHAAVAGGIDRSMANQLACQLALGASELFRKRSGCDPIAGGEARIGSHQALRAIHHALSAAVEAAIARTHEQALDPGA